MADALLSSDPSSPLPRAGRRRRRRRTWTAARARELLVYGIVVGSALAFGAQHPWVAAGCSIASVALAWLSIDRFETFPRLFWLAALLSAYCALQALPLPLAYLQHLSPTSAEVWSESLRPFHQGQPTWGSISYDRGASALEAMKWMTYALTLLGAAVIRRERGAAWLADLIFVSALAVALVTLAHGLLDVHRVYGFFEPSFLTERFRRGPLLNSNNLASYVNVGLGAASGLWLSQRSALPRWLLGAGGTALVLTALLSGSRAGAVALALGACSLLLWYGLIAESRRRWRSLAAGGSAVLLLGFAVALLVAGERLLGEWLTRDMARKIAGWRWTIGLIKENPWFGVGRGAFESALPAYRQPLAFDWTSVFSHPENLPLQWLSEWGVVVGGVGLAFAAALVGKAVWRGRKDALTVGVAVGLGALVLQNLADLGSEVPAIALIAVVACTAVLERDSLRREPTVRRRASRYAVVAIGAATILAALGLGRQSVRLEREQLGLAYRTLKVTDAGARRAFFQRLRQAMVRHPAEPYFPLLGGLVAYRAHEQGVLGWLNRALERGPAHGTTHLVLADALRRLAAREQALMHLRYALEFDSTLQRAVVPRATKWARNLDELERSLPGGPGLLVECCPYLVDSSRKTDCWRRAARARPRDAKPREQLARELAQAIALVQPPCAAAQAGECRDEIRRIARELEQQGAKSWLAYLAVGRVGQSREEVLEAVQKQIQLCPAAADATDCSSAALSLADQLGSLPHLSEASEQFVALACGGGDECVAAHDAAAAVFTHHGAWALALRHRLDGARLLPTTARWLGAAEAAVRSKNFSAAQVALDRAQNAGTLSDHERLELERVRTELVQAVTSRENKR